MARQNTWTLTATTGETAWTLPQVIETVTGVKTSDMHKVAEDMYKRLPQCLTVNITKEVKK